MARLFFMLLMIAWVPCVLLLWLAVVHDVTTAIQATFLSAPPTTVLTFLLLYIPSLEGLSRE
jgi:uncharacterized membrane protein